MPFRRLALWLSLAAVGGLLAFVALSDRDRHDQPSRDAHGGQAGAIDSSSPPVGTGETPPAGEAGRAPVPASPPAAGPRSREQLLEDARARLGPLIELFDRQLVPDARSAAMFLDRALAGAAQRVGEYGPLTLDDFPGVASPAEMAELANTIGHVATNAEQWDLLLPGRDSPQVALLERILENGPRIRGMRITLPLEYTLGRLGADGAGLSDGARRELRYVWTHALRSYNDIYMKISVLDTAARNAALEAGLDSVTEEELFLLCPALADAETSLSACENSFLADLDLVLSRYR